MKRVWILLWLMMGIQWQGYANEPDSVFLLAYATAQDQGRSGLRFAWSNNQEYWHAVAGGQAFLKSDYGRWGSQKQMNDPFLLRDAQGTWHCVWSLNSSVNQLAHASSADLVEWGRQDYPYLPAGHHFERPALLKTSAPGLFAVMYQNNGQVETLHTNDFKHFSHINSSSKAVSLPDNRLSISMSGSDVQGTVHRVAWTQVKQLEQAGQAQKYQNSLARESAQSDSILFRNLQPVKTNISLKLAEKKKISDLLFGIFFEDINYAADGGLYAELIQNRDFEYQLSDKEYRDNTWNGQHSWRLEGDGASWLIDSVAPLHPNNPHYAKLTIDQPGASLVNTGYDGIPVQPGEQYRFSVHARNFGAPVKLLVQLKDKNGKLLGQTSITTSTSLWKQYHAVLTATGASQKGQLWVQPMAKGSIALDMISLFPVNTFRRHANGLRNDLATSISDLRPRFVRFPGGCVAHGDGLENIYRWKNTIGPLEARKPQRNLWGYHQTVGIGYYEYFQFCEDIQAEPLPVLAAGVPCQNSAITEKGGGQQGGIPLEEMDDYIQDVLDLVEWANGPADSKWGKLRAAAGHPAPFHLKYIGIGNEDLITDLFEERFTMIYKAVQKKYPDITVIGTVGPFWQGTDYREGWKLATELNVPMVDEHYYESPGWFINHPDFYDGYDRNKSKVYLGEYASRGNSWYNALAEALYLTHIERNADVVHMTSYAPLLAKEQHTQWNPDLIYFNNHTVKPTVNYEIQKLFGNYAGDEYIPVQVESSVLDEAVKKRLGVSVVQNTSDSSLIVKMVNLLPVTNHVHLDMGGAFQGNAAKTALTGAPLGKTVTISKTRTAVGNILEAALDPYSVTVWKINP